MTRPSTRSAGRRTATEPHTSLCFTERSPTKTSATPLISSPSSLVQVLDFSPPEGGWGTPVTVRIKVKHNALPALCARLVFGHQAVNTAVQEFSAAGLAGWQLDAAIPRLASDAKIPMIVQVLDMNSKVIESLTFAEFTYRVSGKSSPFAISEIRLNDSSSFQDQQNPFHAPSHQHQRSSDVPRIHSLHRPRDTYPRQRHPFADRNSTAAVKLLIVQAATVTMIRPRFSG